MGQKVVWLLAASGLALAFALPAQARVVITGAAQTRTVDCAGDTLMVTGTLNNLTVTGECRKVDVTGSNNKLRIEAAASINVTGAANTVTWGRGLGAPQPRISSTGVGNSISRDPQLGGQGEGSPPAAGAEPRSRGRRTGGPAVKILDNNLTQKIDCAGREVSVLGNSNALTLNGECPVVSVLGKDNSVKIDLAGTIKVLGSDNNVLWRAALQGDSPTVQNAGSNNNIDKGTP